MTVEKETRVNSLIPVASGERVVTCGDQFNDSECDMSPIKKVIYDEKEVLDHEGHGHKAVVYKSHFLPLRHSFSQRHHCIHRLINHVYIKETQHSLLFIAPRHGGSSDKTPRSQEY